MKTVAISQRVDVFSDRNEQRDALDQRLIDLLIVAGYLPIPVPTNLLVNPKENDIFSQWVTAIAPSAFILSGGNDIGTLKCRDKVETALLDYAEDTKLPVLGICRGLQMMGVRAGSKLQKVDGHVGTRHILNGEIKHEVNSYHDYVLNSIPFNYEVIARSSDGEIEAIRHQSLPWEAWMWHPEREKVFNDEDIIRLNEVLSE